MRDDGHSITACEHCGQNIAFPPEASGMKADCPHCNLETVLLEDVSKEGASAQAITAAELTEALGATIPRRPISIFYQFGLVLVAIFMVLLPLVYLAFVALVAYGTYWYAVNMRGILSDFGGGVRVYILKAIIYFGPVFGGAISVFFLLKPILARNPKQTETIELNPAEHPRLYQFIAQMCELMRVRMPTRICLSCELNASAGFRRGWLSFLGSDFELTLGLPLVAGLDTRQIAAVVAHELGHCTQTFAMRLGYVINRVDGWFHRVVYQRDSWDAAFEEWQDSVGESRLVLLGLIVSLAVWVSRLTLLVLMMIGHVVSCFLSRQMEYHADRCSMEVAGSAAVESLMLRLREQAIMEQIVTDKLQEVWKKRHQLPDSLPDYYEQLDRRLSDEFREQARMTLINEKAGWFATHPTAAQRIQRARQKSVPGVFTIEKPARALFNNFSRTAALATAAHYRRNLRLPVTDPMLKPAIAFFEHPEPEARRFPAG